MPRRRRQHRVPCGLSVIVRVNIDPPRQHQLPGGVYFAASRTGLAADLREPFAVDRDIARKPVRTTAIDDRAAANNDVMHDVFLRLTSFDF